MPVRHIIPIFADQLSHKIASLKGGDPSRDMIVMMEVRGEVDAVPHHRKKIAFLFAAMRHFAEELRALGWTVDYVALDDPRNQGSFTTELARAVSQYAAEGISVTEPGEWRVRKMLEAWAQDADIRVQFLDDDRFICSHEDFEAWASGRKQLRMEYFYRDMRRRTGLLMDGDKPEGGRWNFDSENRKPASDDLFLPSPSAFPPGETTQSVLEMVRAELPDRFGDLEPFFFAVTRGQALKALDHFIETALADFGAYQDAMLTGQPFLYHSLLSLYINTGLLDPLEVCRRVESAYRDGAVPINSAEGFIRQIIGWREYIRGIYWLKMPGYLAENFFGADRPLPSFYWTAETDMACMRAALGQTKAHAYAHHIQRLMVTGNFALLTGVDPKQIHEWYLAVYVDAFEWVELPNTLGMSQFADGGLLGSKPYVSGGNYINKMSDYCAGCRYSVSKKTGDGACPFNSLYWHFLDRNADKLAGNPRLGPVYRTWGRMSDDKRADYLRTAEAFLSTLD